MAWNWWRSEEWEGTSFTWDLWYSCNYRCSYCFWELDGLWAELAKQNRILAPAEWGKIWDGIHERHGQVKIDVIGGEPLFYPDFFGVAERLTQKHRMLVTTNLSTPLGPLEKQARRLSPETFNFSASYHPEFAKPEEFAAKIRLLKTLGFSPAVLFVAWPPHLPLLDELRRTFAGGLGVPFSVMVFQGRWDGREYPGAYTPEERARIGLSIERERQPGYRKYGLDRQKTLGKPCHAGRIYANIKGNGDVYRCGQDAFGRKPMGNLIDGAFALHAQAAPCPYETCSCKEYRYLDEEMRKEALHRI